MAHVFYTKFYDDDGTDITGKIKNSNISVLSKDNTTNAKVGKHNKYLFYNDVAEFPVLNVTNNQQSTFGSVSKVFEYLYYAAYNTYTIDGVTPRCKDGKRIYLGPQGLVIDEDNGDFYVSFNLGSIPNEVEHGGPRRIKLSGVPNEYVNLLPIIKFNKSGVPQGIEYIVGGNHEGFLSILKDSEGNKKLGVCAYPHGIGTQTKVKKPAGFNEDWNDYYYLHGDKSTYYSFSLEGMFTSNNRNSNQLLHAPEYGGTGLKLTKEFDTSDFDSVPSDSDLRLDTHNNLLQTDGTNKTVFNLDTHKPKSYINITDVTQGSTNTFQSAYFNGAHLYSSFGNQNSMKQPELRVSMVAGDKQSLVDTKLLSSAEVSDFWETEGAWVDSNEKYMYFIIKSYYADNNQKTKLTVYKIELNW